MSDSKRNLTPREWMAFYEQLFREREPVINPPRSQKADAPDAPDACPLPLPRDLGAAAVRPEKGK